MNLSLLWSGIHWIPTLVMTLLSFAIGALWHSRILFGESWKKLTGYPENPGKINLPLIFGGTAFLHALAMAALSGLISGSGPVNGMLTGMMIAAAWILPAMGGTYLFANRSLKLLAIDAGMYLVLFGLAGAVLASW